MGKTLTTYVHITALSICALLQTPAIGADQNWHLRFIGTVYGAPNVGLMPVRIVITKPDGTVWRRMDTTSISKKPFRNIVVKEPTYLSPGKAWFPGDFYERQDRPPDSAIKPDIKPTAPPQQNGTPP